MDITNKCNASTVEIVQCIRDAGLTPSEIDLNQLTKAIKSIVDQAVKENSRYDICEFYYFRNPDLKPGFLAADGILISDAATVYPEAWAYLQTTSGKKLCITEDEWQSMSKATWATLADGKKVGWDGIGGVPFYAVNLATGALRLPDLRGMYAEAAGFDSLGVGGVHGDGMREMQGNSGIQQITAVTGPFEALAVGNGSVGNFGSVSSTNYTRFRASRVVPTANKNQPRAYGVLACVYLGNPS